MSSDKLPALQFYPGDWRKDPGVRALKPIERYVWFEMLLVMHESEPRGYFVLNDKPYPVARFASALNMKPSTVTQIVSSIVELGLCSVSQLGFCYSRRMVRDEDIRQKRKSAGSLGGNPNLVNQNASKTQPIPQAKRKQNPTPSSSSSSSTSLSNSTSVETKQETTIQRCAYGECLNVLLSDDEHIKLTQKYGANALNVAIDVMDAWIASKPNGLTWFQKKYSSAFSVMNSKSSWVWQRVAESAARPTSKGLPMTKQEIKIQKQMDLIAKYKLEEEQADNEKIGSGAIVDSHRITISNIGYSGK